MWEKERKKPSSGLGYIKSESWMKHYLYGRVTARTGTGALAVAKKTSSALSLSFSFRLLFSFSEKQAPLPRELASTGHTVTQCVPHSPTENLHSARASKTARTRHMPPRCWTNGHNISRRGGDKAKIKIQIMKREKGQADVVVNSSLELFQQ